VSLADFATALEPYINLTTRGYGLDQVPAASGWLRSCYDSTGSNSSSVQWVLSPLEKLGQHY
jgi:hypothetical protein